MQFKSGGGGGGGGGGRGGSGGGGGGGGDRGCDGQVKSACGQLGSLPRFGSGGSLVMCRLAC